MKLIIDTFRTQELVVLTDLDTGINEIVLHNTVLGICLGFWKIFESPHASIMLYNPQDQWMLREYAFNRLTAIGFLHKFKGLEGLKAKYPGNTFLVAIDKPSFMTPEFLMMDFDIGYKIEMTPRGDGTYIYIMPATEADKNRL